MNVSESISRFFVSGHYRPVYVSETWVTKQLLPDLQAVCEVAFSGEKSCFYKFLI